MAELAALRSFPWLLSSFGSLQKSHSLQNDWIRGLWRLLWSDLWPICHASGQFSLAWRLSILLWMPYSTQQFLLLQRRPSTLPKWLWKTFWCQMRQVWTVFVTPWSGDANEIFHLSHRLFRLYSLWDHTQPRRPIRSESWTSTYFGISYFAVWPKIFSCCCYCFTICQIFMISSINLCLWNFSSNSYPFDLFDPFQNSKLFKIQSFLKFKAIQNSKLFKLFNFCSRL